MKKVIILSGVIWLVANLLLGLLLSCYEWTNVVFSSIIVVFTGACIYIVDCLKLKEGFKVSLTILFALLGLLQYIIACLMPQQMQDNWGLIVIVVILAFEAVILVSSKFISNKIK